MRFPFYSLGYQKKKKYQLRFIDLCMKYANSSPGLKSMDRYWIQEILKFHERSCISNDLVQKLIDRDFPISSMQNISLFLLSPLVKLINKFFIFFLRIITLQDIIAFIAFQRSTIIDADT